MAAGSSWNNSRWTPNTLQMASGCSRRRKKVGRKNNRSLVWGIQFHPISACPQGLRGILDYEAARSNIKPVVLKGHQHPETDVAAVHQTDRTCLFFPVWPHHSFPQSLCRDCNIVRTLKSSHLHYEAMLLCLPSPDREIMRFCSYQLLVIVNFFFPPPN